MSKITLNFFGEEAIVDSPKDIILLRGKISEKYLLSKHDTAEIILYYIQDNKKIYIINGKDFSKFKESKVDRIYLDVNQNSKLYLDSTIELDKERQKDKKDLEEINKKFKDFSKKKEKIEHVFEDELKQICLKILELNKRKCELIKKKDIELIKMIKEKEHFETKIYYLQKKLSLPITVPIPKEKKSKEISPKNSPKQLPMLNSFKNATRFAPIINLEIQKKIQYSKCRAIASTKAHALKIAKISNYYSLEKESEIEDKIKNSKLKSINKAKSNALKVAKKAHEGIINKISEINKKIEIVKIKSIDKAKSESLKVGIRAYHDSINKKSEIEKTIENIKLKSVTKSKSSALKVGKKYHDDIKNRSAKINKKIECSKLKSIAKAKSEALKVGKRAYDGIINIESEVEKKVKSSKLQSISKNNALKIGKKLLNETEIKKRIELIKSKAIPAAKLSALKVGERAKKESNNKDKKIQNITNNVSVFKKVNEVLTNTVNKVKEIAKDVITSKKEDIIIEEIKDEKEKLKKEEAKKIKEKEKKEQIDKIVKITKEGINEINNITKIVIVQSSNLIDKINNPEKYNNISPDEIIMISEKKEQKKRVAIHFTIICDGCKTKGIRGNRYKCTKCPDFDFCEKCYQKNKESHGHEFKIIEKPTNTRRLGHKNTKYCSRLIGHKDIRCERCGLEPFVGYRYMCVICDDYNLCENCEEEYGKKHNHPFIKITSPHLLNYFNNCYLKMNYYEPNINQ